MGRSRYLAGDERVVLELRRHWAVLVRPVLAAIAMIVLAGSIGWVTGPSSGSARVDLVAGVLALMVAARAGWRVWQWYVDRIVLTDQRIIEVSGILTRKVAAMPLNRLTDVTYRRTLLGRLLGYGDLIVESAGQDQALTRLERLPQPDDFYRTMTELVSGVSPRTDVDVLTVSEDEDTGPLPRVIV